MIHLQRDVLHFRRICFERLPDFYREASAQQAECRLENEFEVLGHLGRNKEFMAAAAVFQFATHEGIPCRLVGAGPGSIICYLLGISNVEPILCGLLFERFRDPSGRWAPEFMFEVQRERREEVLEFVRKNISPDVADKSLKFLTMPDDVALPYLVAEFVRGKSGQDFDLPSIPLNDPAAFSLLCSGNTDGIFQVEGNDTIGNLLALTRPTSVLDVAAIIAVHVINDCFDMNPKEIDNEIFGETVLLRKAPSAKMIVASTQGLILYQEQIMLLLEHFGGIEPADGYFFIREASKQKTSSVSQYRECFMQHATKELGTQASKALFEQLASAAVYACCQAHVMADAMTVYQAAYIKAHHPDEFVCVAKQIPQAD